WDPVDQMKVNVYEAQIIEQELRANRMRELAVGQMARLAGMDPLAGISIATPEELTPITPLIDLDLESAVEAALDNRAELVALRSGIQAREAEAEARFRNFFPDFVLFAEFEYAYSNVADDMTFPYYDPFNTLGFGAGLAIRFDLNVGAKLGQLKKTRAQKTALQMELDGAEASIRLEIEKLFLEMSDARTMVNVREAALKSARGWVIAKLDLFENGMATLQEVIDGLTQFFLAQLAYYQAVYDYNVSVASLERATGVTLIDLTSIEMAN
ncbi:MAG TPA: TolC family protein, partial [Myxococcota bacterium]|nr:TolC family protein [Myxococcota bacterium]